MERRYKNRCAFYIILILLLFGTAYAANFHILGDEKKLFWYNGANYWSERANSSLATNIDWTKPANAGSAGNPLITDGTNAMSWGGNIVATLYLADDGSVSAPGYSFTDDTDTGIYATEDGADYWSRTGR
ncbi:hypothetical protein LCGC14_3148260, partial [marine sediment metagenome]